MPRLLHRPPKYWLHKPTGQAAVKIDGKRLYLGKYGSAASHQRYAEVVASWRESATRATAEVALPATDPIPTEVVVVTPSLLRERCQSGCTLTLNELILVFVQHARSYYRKHGKVTREADQIAEVLRLVREQHGELPADGFGPVLLKELREKMIARDWSRNHLNKQVSRIVRMFKWGVENELVAPDTHARLAAVPGLKKGRSEARETEGVECVDDAVVDQTLPHLTDVVASMIRFQRLTSARPGEVCAIRPGDIDRSGEVWAYTPGSHKTEHHNRGRLIMVGPKAQELLRPFLQRQAGDYCFTPAESEALRYAAIRAARKTPLRPRDRAAEARRAQRGYAPCYDTGTYRHAVQRGCKRAGVTLWAPHQLRHTAATLIRKRYGIEAAQVVCGHESADVTQVYAERDLELARRVALELG